MEGGRQIRRRQFGHGHAPLLSQTSDCWPMHCGCVGTGSRPIVQSSGDAVCCLGLFFGATRRLVTCTRLAASRGCPLSLKSGASFNQTLVLYSSGLGDFDLILFTKPGLHNNIVSGVDLRHFKIGLCLPPSIRASNHPIDPTPPPGGAVPHQVRSRRPWSTAISPHIPLWCDLQLNFVSDWSQRLPQVISPNSLPRTSNMNRPGGFFFLVRRKRTSHLPSPPENAGGHTQRSCFDRANFRGCGCIPQNLKVKGLYAATVARVQIIPAFAPTCDRDVLKVLPDTFLSWTEGRVVLIETAKIMLTPCVLCDRTRAAAATRHARIPRATTSASSKCDIGGSTIA